MRIYWKINVFTIENFLLYYNFNCFDNYFQLQHTITVTALITNKINNVTRGVPNP